MSASCRNTGGKSFTPLFYSNVNQLLINFVPITRECAAWDARRRLKFHVLSILVSNFCNRLISISCLESLIIRCAPISALFFCKIELNIYLLQKTALLYDFYKNIIIMSLHKEYLTNSVKIKLLSVDIFTYSYSLKVSQNLPKNCEKYMVKINILLFSEHGVIWQTSIFRNQKHGTSDSGLLKYVHYLNFVE